MFKLFKIQNNNNLKRVIALVGELVVIEEAGGSLGTLVKDETLSGTFEIDWTKDTFKLKLLADCSLTEINMPTAGKTKPITLYIDPNGFNVTSYPVPWGTIDALTERTQFVIEFIETNDYWVSYGTPDTVIP